MDTPALIKTKLGNCFSTSKFLVDEFFESFGLDRNTAGATVIIYVRDDVPITKKTMIFRVFLLN